MIKLKKISQINLASPKNRFMVNAAIVAYNRPDSILSLIDSLILQTYPVNTIVVVDNSATVAVKNALHQYGDRILYKKMMVNTGSAGGFFHAIEEAKKNCDFIWLFDDDMNIAKNSLERLINAYQILDSDGLCGVLRCWYENTTPKTPQQMNTFAWRGTLIKSSVILKIGLPDKSFFLYGEDVDYALRIRKAGYRMYYVPGSLMWVNAKPTKLCINVLGAKISFHDSPFRLYYSIRNEIIVYKRHHKHIKFVRVICYVIKLLIFMLLGMRQNFSVYTKAVFTGLYHGLSGRNGINSAYRNPL